MRKILIILAFICAVALVGCGKSKAPAERKPETKSEQNKILDISKNHIILTAYELPEEVTVDEAVKMVGGEVPFAAASFYVVRVANSKKALDELSKKGIPAEAFGDKIDARKVCFSAPKLSDDDLIKVLSQIGASDVSVKPLGEIVFYYCNVENSVDAARKLYGMELIDGVLPIEIHADNELPFPGMLK